MVEVGSDNGIGVLSVDQGGALVTPLIAVNSMGLLAGAGQVVGSVSNGGLVSPGSQIGSLSIDGDFMQESEGRLLVEIASLTDFDQLNITEAAFLDGTLEVQLQGAFVPGLGDTFPVVGATEGILGSFTNELLPALGNGLRFRLNYSTSQLNLEVVPQSLVGDFDGDGLINGTDVDGLVVVIASGSGNPSFDLTGDGFVNGNDLDQWLVVAGAANLPSGNPYLYGDATLDGEVDELDFNVWNNNQFTSTPAWTLGDFTADGAIDGSDFGRWNAHKFTSSNVTVAIPEPSCTILCMFSLMFLIRLSHFVVQTPSSSPGS
jgi:hypothetical protein